jgi:hypothetical protein
MLSNSKRRPVANISRHLMRSMSFVKFGNAFPKTFDMADQFPKELWREKKGHMAYIGPSLDDCLSPATWATRIIPTKGKGAPLHGLRDQFVNEWMFSIKPSTFVNRANLQKRYLTHPPAGIALWLEAPIVAQFSLEVSRHVEQRSHVAIQALAHSCHRVGRPQPRMRQP